VDLSAPTRTVYSVSRLNRETRFLLQECFGSLWIEGEISNLSAPASGHLYFTLKDAEAQVRCALFRPQARSLRYKPRNGAQVLVKAQVGLYEPRGDFQLVVETIEAAGDGALLRAFEALKHQLAAEGLFDAAHKKPIPALPRGIGVVTSPTGAALRDVLTVLQRRFPAIPVIVFPTQVQGAEAQHAIAGALARADRLKLCDVLILARGGGALEDLWAFNEETVARAIHACATPIIAGIGHETDFTIADFVADHRAPTPSAAAEAASPDRADWLERFQRLEARLRRGGGIVLERRERTRAFLAARLARVHPEQRLRTQSQRLDALAARLQRALSRHLAQARHHLDRQTARLLRHDPTARLDHFAAAYPRLETRLATTLRRILENRRQRCAAAAQRLGTLSPLATLARGYAIAYRPATGHLLRSAAEARPGEKLDLRLGEGVLEVRVEALREA